MSGGPHLEYRRTATRSESGREVRRSRVTAPNGWSGEEAVTNDRYHRTVCASRPVGKKWTTLCLVCGQPDALSAVSCDLAGCHVLATGRAYLFAIGTPVRPASPDVPTHDAPRPRGGVVVFSAVSETTLSPDPCGARILLPGARSRPASRPSPVPGPGRDRVLLPTLPPPRPAIVPRCDVRRTA